MQSVGRDLNNSAFFFVLLPALQQRPPVKCKTPFRVLRLLLPSKLLAVHFQQSIDFRSLFPRVPSILFFEAFFFSPPPSFSFQNLAKATYRVTFDTEAYFEKTGAPCFYPEVAVLFRVDAPEEHYHIPLLISPFGYSTYRGS